MSSEIPVDWDVFCQEHSNFFHLPAWQALLTEAFDATAFYLDRDGIRCCVQVFSAGPFRLAYVGFPVGGSVSGETISKNFLSALLKSSPEFQADLLRIPVSGFTVSPSFEGKTIETPETAITELQRWSPESLDSAVLRNLKRANSRDLKTRTALNEADGDTMFDLYRNAVTRHGGMHRYSRAYFRGIVTLSVHEPRLHCNLAEYDGRVIGFIVTVDNIDTTYYLHGGISMEHREFRPSDLLFFEAISASKQRGQKVFNMLSSPRKQYSLIRFKEKWGGETRMHRTYQFVISPVRGRLFSVAESCYRVLSG